jgi:hypothetical protein
MAANIYIYCPADADGLNRCDLKDELEAFFDGAAEDCGAGSGISGFNLDYEFSEDEDVHTWADRLKAFLESIDVRLGTRFDVFPDGWEPGGEWRRVVVFGEDWRRIDHPDSAP